MTVLTACGLAGERLKGEAPASLFTSPTQFAKELRNLANESAVAILRAHDWRKLTKTATITGDGSTTAHSLPSDYDRMPKKADVYDVTTSSPIVPLSDPDEYLRIQIENFSSMSPGFWILQGGYMNVYPAIASAATVKYPYIRNTVFTGGTKTQATADADTFDLPERLLTLDLIWRWRAQKRLEYSEDMQNFNIALSEEINHDKGSRILTVGKPRSYGNVTIAYPKALGS